MMTTVPAGGGGRFDFDDGGSYVGDWSEGMANGYGVCSGPDGQAEFAGAWQLGFETSGVFRAGTSAAGGAVYEGQWLQGRRHGLGIDNRGLAASGVVDGPRWLYRGEWTQGFRGRYGVRQSTATGTKYEGTWTAGLQDGYGVETYADGGTYEGQWLRGVRHGYGVRQSVSYDLAVRFPIQSAFSAAGVNALASPGVLEKEDDVMLRERDARVEESRGGFVLLARTTPLDGGSGRRMVLDKHGKPSIRKTIVSMMRQRSTGDVRDSSSSRSSSRMSGSVRSTSSYASYASSTTTGPGSVHSDEGSEASFVCEIDIANAVHGPQIVERYCGEWKGDRRTGYGIAERSDGLRYEGEWASNRKHGYGVTTLQDGMRIEGKYKNNVLVASSSGARSSSKIFTLRSGKIRDRVDNAVRAAQKAADVARQKADIANNRMVSARTKAEQAQEAARKASADAEVAMSTARQYSPASSQPGRNIVANRPAPEIDLNADFTYVDGYDAAAAMTPPINARSSQPKLFSLFRSKRSAEPTSIQPMQTTITAGSYSGPRPPHQSSIRRQDSPPYHDYQQHGNPPYQGYQHGNQPYPGYQQGNQPYQGYQQGVPQLLVTAPSRPDTAEFTDADWVRGGDMRQVNSGQPTAWQTINAVDHSQAGYGHVNGSHGWAAPSHPQNVEFDAVHAQTQSYQQSPPYAGWSNQRDGSPRRSPRLGGGPQRSFDDHWAADDGQRTSDDVGSWERRKSLPSIVKLPVTPTAPVKPTVSSATSAAAPLRRQMDTFVIENGVRKRVRSIYAADNAAAATAAAGSSRTTSTSRARQRRMYSIETPRRADMGSVPDVSHVPENEVLPREVVAVLSQHRREELIRQRADDELRRQNQILFCFGDIKDWFERRRMLVLLLVVNISLASVFYNLLYQ